MLRAQAWMRVDGYIIPHSGVGWDSRAAYGLCCLFMWRPEPKTPGEPLQQWPDAASKDVSSGPDAPDTPDTTSANDAGDTTVADDVRDATPTLDVSSDAPPRQAPAFPEPASN